MHGLECVCVRVNKKCKLLLALMSHRKCISERERGGEGGGRERERVRERENVRVYVCVCVCVSTTRTHTHITYMYTHTQQQQQQQKQTLTCLSCVCVCIFVCDAHHELFPHAWTYTTSNTSKEKNVEQNLQFTNSLHTGKHPHNILCHPVALCLYMCQSDTGLMKEINKK